MKLARPVLGQGRNGAQAVRELRRCGGGVRSQEGKGAGASPQPGTTKFVSFHRFPCSTEQKEL